MATIPDWFVIGGFGFAVSMAVTVMFDRPTDSQALLEVVSDRETLLFSIAAGAGVAFSTVMF